MKNISWLINGILVIAVAILYYLHFSRVDQNVKSSETPELATLEKEVASEGNLKIAYVNIDSLQKKYALYEELIQQLKSKQKRYERELASKTKAFEEKVIAFQKDAPTMSQFEGQTKQQELAEEEQKLYSLREEFSTQFQNEELKLNDKFQQTVKDYLTQLNDEANYDLIIGSSQLGSMILDYANRIDITDTLIDGLNVEYHKSKEVE